MSENRNGLYYESLDIRNQVLSRNIGEYSGYNRSLLYNGGLAIGMPYAVETEFVPYTLSEKAAEGIHLNLSLTKEPNPKINVLYRQGGLFGYTHEVINPYFDWLNRNQNLLESYFDYASTEDIQHRLDRFPNSLPWGKSSITSDVESGGLRAYSSHNDPQNSEYFDDYTTYIRNIFTHGLSFDNHLGEHYITGLLYGETTNENVDNGVQKFIEEKAGYITDDVDEVLKPIEDTKLGYIGKLIVDKEQSLQINGFNERSIKYEHRPITNESSFVLGLGTGNENNYGLGVSSFNEARIQDKKFIQEADVVLNNNLEFDKISFQRDLLRKNIRKNKYINFHIGGEYGGRESYVEYYNVKDNGFVVYYEDFDETLPGVSIAINSEEKKENEIGDSVEGFFRGTGVYDGPIGKEEHYDEQDGINSGERDIASRKISYNETEIVGLVNDDGFSSRENSLLERTKKLFQDHKIKTLVGRFHTSADDNGATSTHLTQSATDPTYGISHGRNLLKLNPTYENGYENPYCRVWTYHHQYSQMTDLIRPFSEDGKFMSLDGLQSRYPGRPILRNGGQGSWADKTVLNKNGMVNIVPTRKIGKGDQDVIRAKQCMFSIENLAWKGVNKSLANIDSGEIGPLGGRIMWFPPYNLSFNESVSVSWGSNDFIGRGERIYSYTNTERTGSLSFTILADHPSILDYWMNSDNRRNKPGSEEDQQKVLRFFAGCDNLEAEEQVMSQDVGITRTTYEMNEEINNNPKNDQDRTTEKPNDTTEEKRTTAPPDEFTTGNSIGFYVFFPNNFSGVDFLENPYVATNYLVSGKNGFEFSPNLGPDEEHHILPTCATTIGDWDKNIVMLTGFYGYEMASGNGLTEDSVANEINAYNTIKSHDNGRDYLWGYGIDTYTASKNAEVRKNRPYMRQERLTAGTGKVYPANYCDTTNYHLNSEPNTAVDEACAYSFMDVAEALTTNYKYNGKGDPVRVEEIKNILGIKGADTNNIAGRKYYFAIAGGASVHGVVDRNEGLSQRRARWLKAWLEDCFKKLNLKVDYDENSKIPSKTGIEGGEESKDVNSESAKRGRYAKAVIYWNDEDVKDATESVKQYESSSGTSDTATIVEKAINMDSDNVDNEKISESATFTRSTTLQNFSSTRYRDEEEFFDMLKESDPVIYKNIVDKVKYFDPVFHSITPEGFNARLSFLHQCTRQGPTMSSSDLSQNNGFNGAGYAGNLSFGRAPVCVLRLGDFFNTRIIINSVSIQYETAQWDLNPEGIGVQPMLANVTLGIIFQGGSSLGGPIQRLQNAVSFNFYANQEVYDDRADVAVYKDGKLDPEKSLIWMPGYGSLNLGEVKNATEILSQSGDKIKMAETKNGAVGEEMKRAEVDKTHEIQEILKRYSQTEVIEEVEE